MKRLQELKSKFTTIKDSMVAFANRPETKLILKSAGKTMGGSALIGLTAGVVLHTVPVAAFAVGIVGGGLWGYRCGKELDRQLAELYAKRLTEDPVLKDILQNAMDKLQAMNLEMQVSSFV